jgi:hypothetical protein
MNTITANDLKTKGVVTIGEHLAKDHEAMITVRGKKRFVVMDIEHYNYLRECELEAALLEAKNDLEKGNYIVESVDKHIERLRNDEEI